MKTVNNLPNVPYPMWTNKIARWCLAGAAVLSMFSAPILAQHSAAAKTSSPWWKNGVVYEIYPRSFQDSNGDGTGDLNGITSRLDYVKTLGVDAIWLAPIYPSPQADFGYDISNFDDVDPQYGSLRDFDHLVEEAKKRDLRIILDITPNHTSDKHPWFIESAGSQNNAKADWFVWSDGKIGPDGKRQPPNNWLSLFGGSMWQWVPARQQYYLHQFLAQQPDLNWNNPAVEKAMQSQMRFWLDRGVAGFRLDAVQAMLEDTTLADQSKMTGPPSNPFAAIANNGFSVDKTIDLPGDVDILRRMRAMVDKYPGDRVLIGETAFFKGEDADRFYGGAAHDVLQLPMSMQVGIFNKLDAASWRVPLNDIETKVHSSEPVLVIDNHDNPRMDRYCAVANGAAAGADCKQIQKMLTTVLFLSRSTVLMYNGDEIGMKTTPPERLEDVKDPFGRASWPKDKGRDGERTPMQWDEGKNAGFSTADKTWLPIPPMYKTVNVQAESSDAGSMLAWYKLLIGMKRSDSALHDGDFKMLDTGNESILAFTRTAGARTVVVVTNYSGAAQEVHLPQMENRTLAKLAANYIAQTGAAILNGKLTIPAYGAFIGALQ